MLNAHQQIHDFLVLFDNKQVLGAMAAKLLCVRYFRATYKPPLFASL